MEGNIGFKSAEVPTDENFKPFGYGLIAYSTIEEAAQMIHKYPKILDFDFSESRIS